MVVTDSRALISHMTTRTSVMAAAALIKVLLVVGVRILHLPVQVPFISPVLPERIQEPSLAFRAGLNLPRSVVETTRMSTKNRHVHANRSPTLVYTEPAFAD